MDQCEQCGSKYLATKAWQRFCSLRCRNAWHRGLRREDKIADQRRGYLVPSQDVLALAGVSAAPSEFKRRF
jgi:hypothetical protein